MLLMNLWLDVQARVLGKARGQKQYSSVHNWIGRNSVWGQSYTTDLNRILYVILVDKCSAWYRVYRLSVHYRYA